MSLKKFLLVVVIAAGMISGCGRHDTGMVRERMESPSEYSFDFGSVPPGKVLEHTFSVPNISLKTLNIKEVSTSCGCTSAKIKDMAIAPHESTTLEVKVDTKGRSGAVQQFAYLRTDNLDNPIIKYIIRANVVKK